MEKLSDYIRNECCGVLCDKAGLADRVEQLELINKCLQDDLNGLDDLAAEFDKRIEAKCRLVFFTAVELYSDRAYSDSQLEKRWLQFKAEQGL